jgi:hypothetical protein
VSLEANGAFALRLVSCVPGIGVVSLLAWVTCELAPDVRLFDCGRKYVWPVEGVNSGNSDAKENILIRESTADN